MSTSTEGRRAAVIIDDDEDIRTLLGMILAEAGFEVFSAATGLDAISLIRESQPALITLDVNMPGMDGFETLKRIRTFSDAHVLMVSARDDEFDTVNGFHSGADDYIVKPFRPRELRARIDAALRRRLVDPVPDVVTLSNRARLSETASRATESARTTVPEPRKTSTRGTATRSAPPAEVSQSQPSEQITLPSNDLEVRPDAEPAHPETEQAADVAIAADVVDFTEHNGLRLSVSMRLASLDSVDLDLTRTEFELIAALMESKRRVRSKADLTLVLRGEHYVTAYFVDDSDKRAIEAHMSNLRRKLNDSAAVPRFIETVRGVGYRLAAQTVTAA